MNKKNSIVHSTLSNFYVSNYKISIMHIKEMIGCSNVQELVSFSKIYVFRKSHLRENRRGALIQTSFSDKKLKCVFWQ